MSGGLLASVDDGEAEVQSSYKGPLQTMDASVPMRYGLLLISVVIFGVYDRISFLMVGSYGFFFSFT